MGGTEEMEESDHRSDRRRDSSETEARTLVQWRFVVTLPRFSHGWRELLWSQKRIEEKRHYLTRSFSSPVYLCWFNDARVPRIIKKKLDDQVGSTWSLFFRFIRFYLHKVVTLILPLTLICQGQNLHFSLILVPLERVFGYLSNKTKISQIRCDLGELRRNY